jgi:hypothetical protein
VPEDMAAGGISVKKENTPGKYYEKIKPAPGEASVSCLLNHAKIEYRYLSLMIYRRPG